MLKGVNLQGCNEPYERPEKKEKTINDFYMVYDYIKIGI
jgi:hypothetical protein